MDALLGRDAEIVRLAAAVRDLRRGRGGLLWVEGESGIGKTALVDVTVADAREQGVAVFRAAGDEELQPFALRLFSGLLAATPTGQDVRDPTLVAIEEVVDEVARRCADGPLLLVCEDLQWADPVSLTTFARLAGTVAVRPLLLVGTLMTGVAGTPADELRDLAGGVLDLGPLGEADALALFTRGLPAPPEPRLVDLLAEAGGNPFYITELAKSLVREDPGDADEGAAPTSLGATLDRRLRRLGSETHGLLRMAALLGATFDVQELATVLGRSPASMVTGLDEAHQADVITETGDGRLAFRHGLIRRALIDELSVSLRSALHRQFAQALADYGAPFTAVAAHLLAAPGPAGPWVSAWLAALPERVLRIAADPAATLLTSALEGLALPPQRKEVLAARLLPVLRSLGRETQADEVAAELLGYTTDPDRRAAAWLGRFTSANRGQRLTEALALGSAAIHDPLLRPGSRALLRARRAAVLLKMGETGTSRYEGERALSEAEAAGDPVAIAYARHTMSHVDHDPAHVLAHLDAGLATLAAAGAVGDVPELHALLLGNRLAALNNLGRPEEFRTAAKELPAVIRRVGRNRSASLLLAAAMGNFDFGAWDDALGYLDLMPYELPDSARLGHHAVAALIHAHREAWSDTARELRIGAGIERAVGDARIWSGYLVAADAMRAEADGDLPAAVRLLSTWMDPSVGIDGRERYMWLPWLARLARETGDPALASEVAAAAGRDASTPDAFAMQIAAARLCRAQVEDDAAALRAVSEVYAEHGWPLMRAFALEEAAVRLAGTGDTEGARSAFTEAVRGYAAIGATFDVRRADSRLRPYGIRRGSRTLDRRPESGRESLTAAERRVAELVGAGRTNTEVAAELFLSPRTVQTHLTRILRKLGYTSRLDLVVAARGGD